MDTLPTTHDLNAALGALARLYARLLPCGVNPSDSVELYTLHRHAQRLYAMTLGLYETQSIPAMDVTPALKK